LGLFFVLVVVIDDFEIGIDHIIILFGG